MFKINKEIKICISITIDKKIYFISCISKCVAFSNIILLEQKYVLIIRLEH